MVRGVSPIGGGGGGGGAGGAGGAAGMDPAMGAPGGGIGGGGGGGGGGGAPGGADMGGTEGSINMSLIPTPPAPLQLHNITSLYSRTLWGSGSTSTFVKAPLCFAHTHTSLWYEVSVSMATGLWGESRG